MRRHLITCDIFAFHLHVVVAFGGYSPLKRYRLLPEAFVLFDFMHSGKQESVIERIKEAFRSLLSKLHC
jgi:hypothetical protein